MKTFYKMIWIVRALWLVYKCVFIALWSTKIRGQYGWLCLQVVRIYSFVKEIKLYIRASYIFFLFVKTENNNFIKKIKHVISAFIDWWKPRQSLWEFSSRWNPRLRLGLSLIYSRILPNVHLGFHLAMKARRTCFIS